MNFVRKFTKELTVVDQPKSGFDPQQHAGNQQEDQELTDYLKQEEGHTDDSAKQELKNNREEVKKRHKKHKEKER